MASSVLAPVQERGRAALEQLGLPNRRQEPWRLTDLKRLAAVLELPASASPLSTPLPASLDGVTRLCSMVLMIPWPSRGFRKESQR